MIIGPAPMMRTECISVRLGMLGRALLLRPQGLLVALQSLVESLHAIAQSPFVEIRNRHRAIRLDRSIVTFNRLIEFSQSLQGGPFFYQRFRIGCIHSQRFLE